MPTTLVRETPVRRTQSNRHHFKTIEISPDQQSLAADLVELWDCRELVFNFVWRDLTTRYRQTVLGASWAVIQPLGMMLVMAIVFGRLIHAPTDNVPYPVFVYVSLLPWQYFSSALTRASNSVLGAGGLLKKIYFPRLAVPIASVLPALVDFAIAFVLVLAIFPLYHVPVHWQIVCLPFFVGLAVLAAFGIGLWTAAFHVKYRDVFHIVPFALQLWMFASPVAYSSSAVPQQFRLLYNLNPLVGIIDGFRWCLLGSHTMFAESVVSAVIVVTLLVVSGIVYFRSAEGSFADFV